MKDRIAFLSTEIDYHRNAYYNSTAEISDSDFDQLIDQLTKLDPKNPSITSIGAPVGNSEWKKIEHSFNVGSLNKSSNLIEMNDWIDQYAAKDSELFLVDKVDGLSVVLNYEDGKLISAGSRGDGKVGDNIYRNVIKMKGVLQQLPLPFTGSIRGEVILKKKDLKEQFPDQKNARNISSGVSRRLDGVGCEHLSILFYYVTGNVEFKTEETQMNYIESLGLSTPRWSVSRHDHKDFIKEIYEEYQGRIRDELEYEIDGLVIRLNDLETQLDFGESDSRPKGAVALKFPVEKATATITGIHIQLGSVGGRLTPVAEFYPIYLTGAEITRASLHNFKRIKDLGIDVGAEVSISRRGEIIPHVEVVLKPMDTVFPTPTQCPVCMGPVEFQGEYLVCSSTDSCIGQLKGRISTWINTLGVLEFGDKIVEKLVESGLVEKVSDLYKLSVEDLASLERMGDVSAKKCYDILWSHKELPLDVLLGGLSIPTAAASTFKMLIESGYDSLEKILGMSLEQLQSVRGIGGVKANSVFEGLKRNEKEIKEIIMSGISIKEAVSGGLSGMKICITGSTNIKRNDLKTMISESGGVFKSSISRDCTHLIIADPSSTSIKAKGARDLGIKLISEDQFLDMLK